MWRAWGAPQRGGLGAVRHARALLVLVYLPGISAKGDPALLRTSGRTLDGALDAWLAITAGLFAISASLYAWRAGAARGQRRA